MKRPRFTLVAAAVALAVTLAGPMSVTAQNMQDYAAVPEFVANTLTPNILMVMDNTASLRLRADCDINVSPYDLCPAFSQSKAYTGMFDSMKCYTYDTTNTRFDVAATVKASVSTNCGTTEWDGNFLNWITFRRIDAVKKAMIGGICALARAADGTCPPLASKITMTLQEVIVHRNADRRVIGTSAVPNGTGANNTKYRMPDSVRTSGTTPGSIFFHVIGWDVAGMKGYFCVDDENAQPGDLAASCSDGDGYTEQKFRMRLAVNPEPTGVIQQIGERARFGLMVFHAGFDQPDFLGNLTYGGTKVLVPIGSFQGTKLDDVGGTEQVTDYTSNKAAMIAGAEQTLNVYGTPLAESLYEAIRYFAQVQPAFQPPATWPGTPSSATASQYVWPIAFSGGTSNGVNFATKGKGSIHGSLAEQTALVSGETCPAGYIVNACGRDPYFHGGNHTPAWSSPSSVADCCKSFIIVFTDGAPDYDNAGGTVPAALLDYAHADHGAHCTGSQNLVGAPPASATCYWGTDGKGAGMSNANILSQHRTDTQPTGLHYLDDVALWGHVTDLRQATIPVINEAGHPLTGVQNLTIYTFLAFGDFNGQASLMQTAKMGAFEDSNGNNRPDLQTEWDKVINATGATGQDGIPDGYYQSSNVDDLQDRILATIASILKKSSSGTSLAVQSSSITGEGAVYQTYFYAGQPNDSLNIEVKWAGYLQGLFMDIYGNLREDSIADGKLILTDDKIVKTKYDSVPTSPTYQKVLVDFFSDTNGDGKADGACSPCNKELKDIKPIWEAGKQLALMNSSARNLRTWWDTNEDGVVDAGEEAPFDATFIAGALANRLSTAAYPYTAANLLSFVRGDYVTDLRDRRIEIPSGSGTQKVWRLGDIAHSTPTLVGAPRERYDIIYGDATYSTFYTTWKNRRQVMYAGANDGVLHAFNAGYYHRGDDTGTGGVVEHGWFTRTPSDNSSGPLLGDELWGFIPYELIPHLQFLARPDYSHVYFVDLKPKITDVRIFCDSGGNTPMGCITGQASTAHPNGWGTILIAGMRLGGSCDTCAAQNAQLMTINRDFNGDGDTTDAGDTRTFRTAYFVLDITNPEQNPKLLWSFTDADTGLTTSYPAVARVYTGGNKYDPNTAKWFFVAGAGPTRYDGSSTQGANSFVIDLMTGPGAGNSLLTEIPSSDNEAPVSLGDYTSVDFNLDYKVDVLYMGRIKDTGSTPRWKGGVTRLTTGGGSTNLSTWGRDNSGERWPSRLIRATTPSGTVVGPVYVAPTVSMDDGGKLWVFVGTGRYFHFSDRVNSETQYIVGVKDPVPTGGCAETLANNWCRQEDLVDVTNAAVCVVCAGNQVTGVGGGVTSLLGTATTTLQGLVQSKHGWAITLTTPRERVLVSPTVYGGTVFVPTFIPEDDICSGLGNANLYALFYQTGSAYKESVVGTYDGGGGNTNVSRSISLGSVGMVSQVGVHLGAQGTGNNGSSSGTGCSSGVNLITQYSSGGYTDVCGKPVLSSWSRYLSWADQKY